MLLKKYKNQFFTHFRDHSIGIGNFELIENDNLFKLKYKDTIFYYLIDYSPSDFDKFDYRFIQFKKKFSLSNSHTNWCDFSTIISSFDL
jgi:hypothetical protein